MAEETFKFLNCSADEHSLNYIQTSLGRTNFGVENDQINPTLIDAKLGVVMW